MARPAPTAGRLLLDGSPSKSQLNPWRNAAGAAEKRVGQSADGSVEFWSSGGLLHRASPGTEPQERESFNLHAKHIEVISLVEGEVALVTYYSEGSMQPKGYPTVPHYLTRVMEVYVKEDGKWKRRAAHWSAVNGGSGTSQAAE